MQFAYVQLTHGITIPLVTLALHAITLRARIKWLVRMIALATFALPSSEENATHDEYLRPEI